MNLCGGARSLDAEDDVEAGIGLDDAGDLADGETLGQLKLVRVIRVLRLIKLVRLIQACKKIQTCMKQVWIESCAS